MDGKRGDSGDVTKTMTGSDFRSIQISAKHSSTELTNIPVEEINMQGKQCQKFARHAVKEKA